MAKKDGNGQKDAQALLEEMRQEREEMRRVREEDRKSQQILKDAVLDLKEKVEKDDTREKAGLVLVNTLYRTPDALLDELTDIPHLMCRPIASLRTLERVGSKAVRSGKESLLTDYMNFFLRARRSIEGKHLAKGRMLASDQLSQAGKEEGIEGFDMGREE